MYLQKQKKLWKKNYFFVGILSANNEKSRIRIRKSAVGIPGSESVPKSHGSTTLEQGLQFTKKLMWTKLVIKIGEKRAYKLSQTFCLLVTRYLKNKLVLSNPLKMYPFYNYEPMIKVYSQNVVFTAVLRIHDILVWIRIRGSMLLTNGSGSWIRILLFSSLSFKMPTKN